MSKPSLCVYVRVCVCLRVGGWVSVCGEGGGSGRKIFQNVFG